MSRSISFLPPLKLVPRPFSPGCGKTLVKTRISDGYQVRLPTTRDSQRSLSRIRLPHTPLPRIHSWWSRSLPFFSVSGRSSIPVTILFTISFGLAYHSSDRPRPLLSRPVAQLAAATLLPDDCGSSSMYYSTGTANETTSRHEVGRIRSSFAHGILGITEMIVS